MKRIIILMMTMILLTGCSDDFEGRDDYPYVRYQHDMWEFGKYSRNIEVPDGYILNQGHSYDVVETEDGYDIVLHFMKDSANE